MPVDGSADSFYAPTEHGELVFGVGNAATLDADHGYHAWLFTLGGNAAVSLKVSTSTANLDTVMYLYRQDSDSGGWGSYIARNDDYQGNVWSGLDEDLGAGDYKIMLKGYKKAIHGSFSLKAECTGGGCPNVDGGCLEEDQEWNETTDLGASCAGAIAAVVKAPVVSSNNFFVSKQELCTMPTYVQSAWDHYYYYFLEWYSDMWEDHEPDPESFGFDFFVTDLGPAGKIMDVDWGGDEMAMTYLVGPDGGMVLYFQHNQSPDVGFNCAAKGEPSQEWGSESCFLHMVRDWRPGFGTEDTGQKTLAIQEATLETLPAGPLAALTFYAELFEVAEGESADCAWTVWTEDGDAQTWEVTIRAGEAPETTLHLLTTKWDNHVFYTEGPDGKTFPCTWVNLD